MLREGIRNHYLIRISTTQDYLVVFRKRTTVVSENFSAYFETCGGENRW